MNRIQVTVPFDRTHAVFDILSATPGIQENRLLRLSADNALMIQAHISNEHLHDAIDRLKAIGVGVDFGYIDVTEIHMSLPHESEVGESAHIHREPELIVEEIYETVHRGVVLSFDTITFGVLAALLTGLGFLMNNGTVVLAATLLCPLMGPMLGIALGYVIHDRSLLIHGTKNELTLLALPLCSGLFLGLVVCIFWPAFPLTLLGHIEHGELTEMSRYAYFSWLDVFVALFSGAAVAVSITHGDMASLVGVAIAATLMPPAVNSSVVIVMALWIGSGTLVSVAAGAFYLLLMNIAAIVFAAALMLKVKRLGPLRYRSSTWVAVTNYRRQKSEQLYHRAVPRREDEGSVESTS
ncbi:MAG: DUF389 domain-containing protein [Candidatus Thorarchaeota archaeon]|nr:DUF389 domain-containing protein [Candidatus Thorarchaeota archaeon]